ncbi:MAG: sulfatase-like hydrolase/transferase [Pseudomonadota bacterium]
MTSESAPNILIIMTDQHRPDHTGFGGNNVVQTPNLDALAAKSMRFDRAFVANPICMPNRSSIFTSRMPSLHGTRYNGIALDWRAETFPRLLKNVGYHTAHLGKCHLQNMQIMASMAKKQTDKMAPGDAMHFDHYPAGWDQYENIFRHAKECVEMPEDYYGFGEVDLVVAHSDQCGGHYYQWLLDKGIDPATIQGETGALTYDSPSHMTRKTATPEELYPTHYVTEVTTQFLQARAKQPETPFMAVVSYPDPHHPFTPPGKYFDMYSPADYVMPETFNDKHENSAPHYQKAIQEGPNGLRRGVNMFAPTEVELREMAAKEYGMISMIDDSIGTILKQLGELGMSDNTIIVFTSDHGDMFGDHGVMLKGAMHYEGCTRVPLLIKVPNQQPGICNGLISSLDIGPTLLSLAGLSGFYGMQGIDASGLLSNPEDRIRDEIFIEEDQLNDILRVGTQLRMRTLITEEARLTIYQGYDGIELFDLKNDPHEMENVSNHATLRAEMMERMTRALMFSDDIAPKPTAFA